MDGTYHAVMQCKNDSRDILYLEFKTIPEYRKPGLAGRYVDSQIEPTT
jgi:hypothetical protein